MEDQPRCISEPRPQALVPRLPNELLSYIFAIGCPRPLLYEDRRIDPRPYQVLVGSVCSLWRQIALGTPDLWSVVCVCLQREEEDSQPSLMRSEMLRATIDRSGATKVALFIFSERTCTMHPAVASAIVSILPRTYLLHLNVISHAPLPILPLITLPNLEYLYIEDLDEGNQSSLILSTCPNLKALAYASDGSPSTAEISCLELSQPQALRYTVELFDSARSECLLGLTRLRSLYLEPKTFRESASTHLSHPTLEKLVLAIPQDEYADYPLRDLPRLVELTITDYYGDLEKDRFDCYHYCDMHRDQSKSGKGKAEPVPEPESIGQHPLLRTLVLKTRLLQGQVGRIIVSGSPNLQAIEVWNENILYITADLNTRFTTSIRFIRMVFDCEDAVHSVPSIAALCTQLMARYPSLRIEWLDYRDPYWVQEWGPVLEHAPEGVSCVALPWAWGQVPLPLSQMIQAQ